MSLSAEERETDSKYRIPLLTRDNFPKWEQLIKDYILALDHDDAADIWTAYKWEPADGVDNEAEEEEEEEEDPAERDYQLAVTASDRKLRTKHNMAFKYIRAHLSPAVFDTTMHLPTSVPKLLRHLRSYWNDGSVCDRDKLRTEYQDMRLEQYADMEEFITAFQNKVRVMRSHNLGLVPASSAATMMCCTNSTRTFHEPGRHTRVSWRLCPVVLLLKMQHHTT